MDNKEKKVFGSFALLLFILLVFDIIYRKSFLDFAYLAIIIYNIVKLKKFA